jgi:hypothetical protein
VECPSPLNARVHTSQVSDTFLEGHVHVVNTMTKEGYTHIIVPKELHTILKWEAGKQGISISAYISQLMGINTATTPKTSKKYSFANMLSPGWDLDPRSPPYQGGALPTMLPGHHQ